LFQESLQIVAQQVRLNFQHIPKVPGAQESSARLRGVPHTIPDIAGPCRGNFLATATIGKSRACAKCRLERGFLARCGLLFGVATGFCEKPFWLSGRISFSSLLDHPLIVLCRCLQFTHAKLTPLGFVNQQRSQKDVPTKISQKPQVLKKPFAMGLLIISNFVSSDATEKQMTTISRTCLRPMF
jgi:hypothetical protein